MDSVVINKEADRLLLDNGDCQREASELLLFL